MGVREELAKEYREFEKQRTELREAFSKLTKVPEYQLYVEKLNVLTASKGEELLNDDTPGVEGMVKAMVLKGTIRGLQLAANLVPVMSQIAGAQPEAPQE